MDMNLSMGKIEAEIARCELDRTIRYARIRCLDPNEIIERVCDLNEAENLGTISGGFWS